MAARGFRRARNPEGSQDPGKLPRRSLVPASAVAVIRIWHHRKERGFRAWQPAPMVTVG
jgi:hypothetical protein